uniref:Alpha-2-macroglobulin-like protein 1 n=1 Tax=Anas platyrhynchos TaxID=8839 RepID=A0A8B9TBW4_ANAPL
MPGHAGCTGWGQCPTAGLRVGFYPPSPCRCAHHSLLCPPLLFPVKFRIVSLDKDFVATRANTACPREQDPRGNRIAQWRDVSPRQGIVDLSLPLAAEPALGTYTIEVEGRTRSFSVEEYVLPKFEVTIDIPSTVLEKDEKFLVEICGRYTYGKPVQGKVQATVCRPFLFGRVIYVPEQSSPSTNCIEVGGQVSKAGSMGDILMTSFSQTNGRLQKRVRVKASLVEEGTGRGGGVLLLGSRICCCIHPCMHPHAHSVEVSGFLGEGQVNESANTQESSGSSPHYESAFATLHPFVSKSQSFLQIHQLESNTQALGSILCQGILGLHKASGLPFPSPPLQVMAKGTIATILRKELPMEAGLRGSFSLELPVGPELAPTATVLCYAVLPSGEMVADSTKISLAKCLPNKVSGGCWRPENLPLACHGALLELEAAPRSLCAIRAVDRSVLLLKPEAELSMEEVGGPTGVSPPRAAPWTSQDGGGDDINLVGILASSLFSFLQDAALKLLTNAEIRTACEVLLSSAHPVRYRMSFPAVATRILDVPPPIQEEPPAPRSYFPETWLWDLVPVGEEGSAEVPVTVPDAITEWTAGMFCTAPMGLGLSRTVTLTAFKPFFVELALPYAVTRGEAFTLAATVFNYLRQCLRVRVTLAESAELEVSETVGGMYSGCVCADEARTFRWDVKATSLGEVNITVSTEAIKSEELCGNEEPVVPAQGRVDTVIKPLLVQPGGILVEKAHSSLLCQEAAEEVSLKLPENILEGSQRAHVTVMGDIMGNALQNVDRLLAMPYGCGEQNMVRFAPNIYIQQYLEKSGQLTPDIRAKAQSFLQSGYQRELLYKHADGSYSAFGERDDSGNTWLTAFVLKSFGQARAYVAIEEQHITDALHWLQRQQLKTGCFRSVGKLFNNALQGGVSDELSLSAYVTAALLELGVSPTEPTVSLALQCLEASSTDDLYTQALLAYVCGLAGRQEQHQARLQSLVQRGVKGLLFWQRKGKALPTESLWAAAAPAEVEMTAYVLLAHLTQPQVSSADLSRASQIVRWLSRQQNPYGGFASTQDTVVALQALAKYATLTYGSNGNSVVTVTAPTGSTQDFVLDTSNRLVLQRAALHELPGLYTVQARGQGCALVQVGTARGPRPHVSPMGWQGTPPGFWGGATGATPSLSTGLCPCRYTGQRPTTNMAVIEAKLPSGYIPDKGSVAEVRSLLWLYLTPVPSPQLTKEEETFIFTATQDFPVRNLQPATVTLYDYYETGDRTDAAYSAPCSSGRG